MMNITQKESYGKINNLPKIGLLRLIFLKMAVSVPCALEDALPDFSQINLMLTLKSLQVCLLHTGVNPGYETKGVFPSQRRHRQRLQEDVETRE